ncbi:MAG TPA: SpvB/TcaC N-terminal domain-containing protein, partial [Candidatus Nanopelagicales bacterium]|nr:SpvB/TcaC N-terminal domain-containing protein [Candidatus Nanopelagicales bacterium]
MAPPVSARVVLLALLTLAVVVGCGAAAPDHGGRPSLEQPPLPPAPLDAAGTLPGTAAVQQGALTYRIPLQVPGGRMGVQPELALHYGSRSTEPGILGVGWSIAGLSSIARCQKTRATHGISETVRFDASDGFCLDGAKLHAIEGTHGAPGAEYRTERADFSRILSYGQLPDGGPEYFTVWTRDGQILEYGRTASARGQATLGGHLPPAPPAEDKDLGTGQHIDGPRANWRAPVTLSWHLSRARDRLGNALQVTYLDGGPGSALRVPHEIRYT